MDKSLFTSVPEHIQIVFATGYLGYVIAKSGYRNKERRDDVLYAILVYGLFGYITYDWLAPRFDHFIVPALGACFTTAVVAIVWRKWLKDIWYNILNKQGISNEDNTPDVWTGIIQRTDVAPTQVTVHLKNGEVLECDDVQKFKDAPFPFYYTDTQGNFALYVTGRKTAAGVKIEISHTHDPKWGDRLTYIPREEISRIAARYLKK